MEAEGMYHHSISNNAKPVAPYSHRPPSPPYIHIPVMGRSDTHSTVCLMPSYENVDSSQLTSSEISIITQNVTQIATDSSKEWAYEQRRQAQRITNFLYLGPNSVVRDHAFLQREGITMLLVCRDARMATQGLTSVQKACEAVGIAARYFDLNSPDNLLQRLPEAIKVINDHLLSIYHSQAHGKNEQGQLLVESSTFRRGKVLVTCESGNDRSAAIVTGYLMAVFGQSMVTAVQFICMQRFCCCFDEDLKRKLQSWEDILKARAQVAMVSQGRWADDRAAHSKRRIEDTMEVDGNGGNGGDGRTIDRDRFTGRDTFVPFVDASSLGL